MNCRKCYCNEHIKNIIFHVKYFFERGLRFQGLTKNEKYVVISYYK